MKKFLRRMNRGLALAVAAVIGLVVYFTVDAAAFAKHHRSDIEAMFTDFAAAHSDINVLPEQYLKKDITAPADTELNKLVNERKDIARKYIVSSGYYSYFLDSIDRIVREQITMRDISGFYLKYDVEILNIKGLSSQGPGYAKVSELRYAVSVEYAGTPSGFVFGHSEGMYYDDHIIVSSEKEDETPDPDTIWSKKLESTMYDLFLVNTGDGWKIDQSRGGWSSSSNNNGIPEQIGTLSGKDGE